MSLMVKAVPFTLIGVAFIAFMFAESAPSKSIPATEHVSVTVMMNAAFARGEGPPNAPCLVLYDIDQPGPVSAGKLKAMKKVASKIYDLYGTDPRNAKDMEMAKFIGHVNNDTYFPHARKIVPSSLSGGRRLYVSDIILHRNMLDSDKPKVAMVRVTGREFGTIRQIPFNVVAGK